MMRVKKTSKQPRYVKISSKEKIIRYSIISRDCLKLKWIAKVIMCYGPVSISYSCEEVSIFIINQLSNFLRLFFRFKLTEIFNWYLFRDGCRGLPLLPMQHPEMAHINFQGSVFVSKKTVNKILKLTENRCGRHCSERDAYIGWRIQFFLSRF